MPLTESPTGVTIELPTGRRATIFRWKWTSDDAGFADTLNALLHPLGPSGSDPDPDYTAAVEAARLFKGKVITPRRPPECEPGVVY